MKIKFLFKDVRRRKQLMKYAENVFNGFSQNWLHDAKAQLRFTQFSHECRVEAILYTHGRTFKAEANDESWQHALDSIYNKIERQCERQISKNQKHHDFEHSHLGHLRHLNQGLTYQWNFKHRKAS